MIWLIKYGHIHRHGNITTTYTQPIEHQQHKLQKIKYKNNMWPVITLAICTRSTSLQVDQTWS